MNIGKTLVANLFAISLIGTASAKTDLRITGSTAFRETVYTAIAYILNQGYSYGYVGSALASATQVIFHGTTVVGGYDVYIKTSFSSSGAGITAVAQELTVGLGGTAYGGGAFLADVQSNLVNGAISSPQYDPAEVPDVALSNFYQSSLPPAWQSPVLSGEIVGVVPFVWVRSKGSNSNITNLSTSNGLLLLHGSLTEDKLFSGGNPNINVYAFGDNELSGTRIAALADTGYWLGSYVKQYEPLVTKPGNIGSIQLWPAVGIDGINFPVGDSGFSDDTAVASALSLTNGVANTEYVGYLGINDAATVGSSYWLKFNGQAMSSAAVENGSYAFWGYEQFLYRGSNFPPNEQLSGPALQIATNLERYVVSNASLSGIPLGAMRIRRAGDGGELMTGTIPTVPGFPIISNSIEAVVLDRFPGLAGYDPVKIIGDKDGNLYGVTGAGGGPAGGPGAGTAFKVMPPTADGWWGDLNIVAKFNGANGGDALNLILGNDGNFYGICPTGGKLSYGTIFKLTPAGVLTSVFDCSKAQMPSGELVRDSEGNFYGVLYAGNDIFKVTSSGTFSIIESFGSQVAVQHLVLASDGNLYGAMSNSTGASIYRLTPQGVMTVLYTFNTGDSATALIQGIDGNLYGLTYNRSLFQITTAGVYTNIATFNSGVSNILVQATDGTFYWLGGVGGIPASSLFELAPSATLPTELVKFSLSLSSLTLGGYGHLYGTAGGRVGAGPGFIVRMSP